MSPDATIPTVVARGRVREVAPQANPVTRTFEVKVGLTDPPEAMRLGATVTGRMESRRSPVFEIPATALTKFNQQPAVWIVDPTSTRSRCATSTCCASTRARRRRLATDSIPARSSSPPACRRCIRVRRSACSDRNHDRLQSFGMGAQEPLDHRLPDDRRGRSPGSCPISGSAATRTLPSSSRPWWCRRPGRARPSRTRSSRSPSGSSASCRKRPQLDFLRSFTRAGVTTIFVNLKGSDHRQGSARHLVSRPQEHRRYPPHPAGRHRRTGLQ